MFHTSAPECTSLTLHVDRFQPMTVILFPANLQLLFSFTAFCSYLFLEYAKICRLSRFTPYFPAPHPGQPSHPLAITSSATRFDGEISIQIA